MNAIIYFNTSRPLDKTLLENFLQNSFNCKEFIWITNFYEFAAENETDNQKTYVFLETSTEGFKYHYSVFDINNPGVALKERIEILKKLAHKIQSEILSADDEVNPRSWVLVEPNGQALTIETKNDGALIVEGFYDFPFGDFRTKDKLSQPQIQQLKEAIKYLYARTDINYSTDGPVINGAFNKVKDGFERLKDFAHHYEIRPTGKNQWFDKDEKSKFFISAMKEFRELIEKDLCIFPANFSEVKNIAGGSDSEEYCILLIQPGEEKIIYKQRRKSW